MSKKDSDVLYYLTGSQFPGADEDRLARLSRAVRAASRAVSLSGDLLAAAARRPRDGVGGRSQDGFLASLDDYVRTPGFTTTSATHLGSVSNTMSDPAIPGQYQKMP